GHGPLRAGPLPVAWPEMLPSPALTIERGPAPSAGGGLMDDPPSTEGAEYWTCDGRWGSVSSRGSSACGDCTAGWAAPPAGAAAGAAGGAAAAPETGWPGAAASWPGAAAGWPDAGAGWPGAGAGWPNGDEGAAGAAGAASAVPASALPPSAVP